MMDILLRIMNIIERARTASPVSEAAMIGFGILLVFGFVNCILGYRLLRFWMMLFGFVIGAALGFGGAFSMGYRDRTAFIAGAVGVGVVLAVIAFLSYKVGIFVLGAGLGLGVGVYVLHPTTSLMFFLCILLGVVLGSLAMKWAREVIIVGTSILGGAMAGVSLAKLGGLPDIPYGIVLSIAFALLGMLIQFATNRRKYDEDEDEEEYEEEYGEEEKPSRRRRHPEAAPERESDRYERDSVSRKRRAAASAGAAGVRRRASADNGSRRNSSGRKSRQIDYRLKEARDTAPEYEKTVEFRPRRKQPELDLPLDSFDQERYYTPDSRRSSGRSKGRTYYGADHNYYENDYDREYEDAYEDAYEDDYQDDYEEPIDEELLDEEILKEMMEEEDRKSELLWKRISGRSSRKKKTNGKRNKN